MIAQKQQAKQFKMATTSPKWQPENLELGKTEI